ncbi:MAG: low molecular weight phosphotyrosine protein phosphatase [Deltaproteobacteria bacterium]|nr:MAG: low molecular weight phosphotyrosine protein phosphatase [Deltaproteobacteria bacterium]
MTHHLLFVCTGNICRSPMAEGIARDAGSRMGLDLEVKSASALGLDGDPADRKAIAVCAELGIDIAEHEAQPVTAELMEWADQVLVMEMRHAMDLRFRFPEHDEKIVLLGPFGGKMEIADPIGGWKFTFRRIRDQLRAAVDGYLRQLVVPDRHRR